VACSHVVFFMLKGCWRRDGSCSLDVTERLSPTLGYCCCCFTTLTSHETHKTNHYPPSLLMEKAVSPSSIGQRGRESERGGRERENSEKIQCDSLFFRVLLLLYYYQSNHSVTRNVHWGIMMMTLAWNSYRSKLCFRRGHSNHAAPPY